MDQNETCMSEFTRLINTVYPDYLSRTWEQVRDFYAGFYAGQATKISIGACYGFQGRAEPYYFYEAYSLLKEIAGPFRFWTGLIESEGEIWMLNSHGMGLFQYMLQQPVNSPKWHLMRGLICGVPAHKIDLEFHIRRGYGKQVKDLQDAPDQAAAPSA